MSGKEYFISGIDTDCGKTHITGLLAYHLKQEDVQVITSKLIQTGCTGIAEDIIEHRKKMKTGPFPEDESGITCPFVFSFPASPHLSARIDGMKIDFEVLRSSADTLLQKNEIVLCEGAGGLMVPLTEDFLTIDYIIKYKLPLILVTSSKLGSINHTFLSIELCKQRGIQLHTLVYNKMPGDDTLIANDSYQLIERYAKEAYPHINIIHSDILTESLKTDLSLKKIFIINSREQ